MNLDDDELKIALAALKHFHIEAREEPIKSVPALLCRNYGADRCHELIERIEQHQKDKENGDVRP